MTHQHNLDKFTPWKTRSYELHEEYIHGDPPTEGGQPPIAVAQLARGPRAIVLERALFLNGYTTLVETPDDDPGLDAPRADNGRTWLDIPQVSLQNTRIIMADGRLCEGGAHWPARAERIEIETAWNLNGKTTSQTLPTDLAFGRTDVTNPQCAYPFVTRDSGLAARPLELERMILAAYSGAGDYEPDADELAQHRATAMAATEITLNGMDGWLTAVSRLVEQRLMVCLQTDVRPPDGIRVLLHDRPAAPITTERYSRRDPLRKAIETDTQPATERANRLRYEGGPFQGHRGALLGSPVTPHSKLWRTLVKMYDGRVGRALWEPESPLHGRAIGLNRNLSGIAAEMGIENGRYGVVWSHETRPRPSGTQQNHGAPTAPEADEPGPVIVHILSAAEHDKLRTRVLGPLLQAVVDHEADTGEHAAKQGHPVHELLAECKARRKTSLARA